MPFLTTPLNIDYLITDVRLFVGDTESTLFSDTLIRTAIVNGVKMLQRRWKNRYLVMVSGTIVSDVPSTITVPEGYVCVAVPEGYGVVLSGYAENDVFRNPYHTFADPSTRPISQEDEYPIILAAAVVIRKSYITSSVESFQSWSDGEYAFSNLSSAKSLQMMFEADMSALDAYFKKRLVQPLRSEWNNMC